MTGLAGRLDRLERALVPSDLAPIGGRFYTPDEMHAELEAALARGEEYSLFGGKYYPTKMLLAI